MSETAKKIISGDIRSAARLISDIDNNIPESRKLLKELYPHTGNAYVIGVTGAPGVGKSTLVNQMIAHLRNQKKTVGVIAIDPTSPFTGGAILGDRIRMQRHVKDKDVFIRSLATRGHFGGLTRSTRSGLDVMDAMGKNVIIVETVGVGQDEVEIAKMAHTTVIVTIPGMGDDIQAIKAGILEAGDLFVVNKADHDGSDRTVSDLKNMVEMGTRDESWTPPILKTQAKDGIGVDELIAGIDDHKEHLLKKTGTLNLRKQKQRTTDELGDLAKDLIVQKLVQKLYKGSTLDEAVDMVMDGRSDPYSAAEELVHKVLKD